MFKKLILSIIIVCFMLTPAQAASKPKAPVGLKSTTLSSSQVKISWSKVKGAEYYLLYRSTGGSYYQISKTKRLSFTNSRLIGNTKYWYKVRAGNKSGYSTYSSIVSVTTKKDKIRPAAPSGFRVVTNEYEDKSYDIYWGKNKEPDIKGYYVYQSDNPYTGFTKITFDAGNSLLSSPDFNFYDLNEDEVYYFYVIAIDTSGNESLKSSVFYLSIYEPIYDIRDMTYDDGTPGKQVIFVDNFSITVGQVENKTFDNLGTQAQIKGTWLTIQNLSDSTIYLDEYSTTIEGIDDLLGKHFTPESSITDSKLDQLRFELPSSLAPGEYRQGYLYFDTDLNINKLYFKDTNHKVTIDIPQ